jgi:hypothetical protein
MRTSPLLSPLQELTNRPGSPSICSRANTPESSRSLLAELYRLPEFLLMTEAITAFKEKYGIEISNEFFERYAYVFVDEVPHLARWHVENLGLEQEVAEKWVDYLASVKARYQADLKLKN